MHLRGKSFLYEAVLPGGERETLLEVPRYDFNWQTAYRLAEPKELPEGTRLHCVAHFDNSEDNLNNPDPTKTRPLGRADVGRDDDRLLRLCRAGRHKFASSRPTIDKKVAPRICLTGWIRTPTERSSSRKCPAAFRLYSSSSIRIKTKLSR